jgi:hypothetical protein
MAKIKDIEPCPAAYVAIAPPQRVNVRRQKMKIMRRNVMVWGIGLLVITSSATAGTNVVIALEKTAFLATEPVTVRVTQLRGAATDDQMRFGRFMNGAGTIQVAKGTTVVERVRMSPIQQPKFHAEGMSFFHGVDATSLQPGTYRLTCTLTNWISNEVEFQILDRSKQPSNHASQAIGAAAPQPER